MAEVLMTAEKQAELIERLNYLKSTGRSEMAAKIEEARSFGDLSENAEYDLARDEQATMELEISELETKIANAKIIDEKVKTDSVKVGNKVSFVDSSSGETKEYHIVGSQDTDPLAGKISNESPVGKALLGHKKGDTVIVDTKNGKKELKIIKIS